MLYKGQLYGLANWRLWDWTVFNAELSKLTPEGFLINLLRFGSEMGFHFVIPGLSWKDMGRRASKSPAIYANMHVYAEGHLEMRFHSFSKVLLCWPPSFPSQLCSPWRAKELALPPTHLGIKGMFEDLAQGFSIGLRLARFCGIKDGRLDPLGHCLPHELGWELDGSGEKRMERKMGNVERREDARLGLLGKNHDPWKVVGENLLSWCLMVSGTLEAWV